MTPSPRIELPTTDDLRPVHVGAYLTEDEAREFTFATKAAGHTKSDALRYGVLCYLDLFAEESSDSEARLEPGSTTRAVERPEHEHAA